jgi:hypothetical protein
LWFFTMYWVGSFIPFLIVLPPGHHLLIIPPPPPGCHLPIFLLPSSPCSSSSPSSPHSSSSPSSPLHSSSSSPHHSSSSSSSAGSTHHPMSSSSQGWGRCFLIHHCLVILIMLPISTLQAVACGGGGLSPDDMYLHVVGACASSASSYPISFPTCEQLLAAAVGGAVVLW